MNNTDNSSSSRLHDELNIRFGSRIAIGADCDIAPDITIELAEDAFLYLGNRVSIRRGVVLSIGPGAKIIIDDNVDIGENVFLAAMVGIRIGKGCGISNMVDMHDHNHRDRSINYLPSGELTSYASGFEVAPIIIESGVIISNKVSVTAGVRIGQNTKVGANSVVSRSLPHNVVAVGCPAKPIRTFDGILSKDDLRVELRLAFFGTSIMEHFEAYAAQLYNQADLPSIGSQITVEKLVNRGYPFQLFLSLQARLPSITIRLENHGIGGATSRDVLAKVKTVLEDPFIFYDIAFFGCGINDVWRTFQGRTIEAVDISEFENNCTKAITLLTKRSRRLVCLSETPFGLPDSDNMNHLLSQYNNIIQSIASRSGADYLDIWTPFTRTERELAAWKVDDEQRISLWDDGVHLSKLGDQLVNECILEHLSRTRTIEKLLVYERINRNQAVTKFEKLLPTPGERNS